MPKNKGEDGGESEKPDSPPEDQTPFQRFEEFARKVISVPRAEMEERERAYQEQRRKR